jgi:hypothetical protein
LGCGGNLSAKVPIRSAISRFQGGCDTNRSTPKAPVCSPVKACTTIREGMDMAVLLRSIGSRRLAARNRGRATVRHRFAAGKAQLCGYPEWRETVTGLARVRATRTARIYSPCRADQKRAAANRKMRGRGEEKARPGAIRSRPARHRHAVQGRLVGGAIARAAAYSCACTAAQPASLRRDICHARTLTHNVPLSGRWWPSESACEGSSVHP